MIKIGLISDTHDKLNPKIHEIFRDCQHIIHAGDFASLSILEELKSIAPVTAVRGNCDYGYWAQSLPPTSTVRFEGVQIQVIHNVSFIMLEPETKIVIYGHTHRARQHWGGDVLYINPGSASEPRFSPKASVAILTIEAGKLEIDNIDY